MASRGTPRASAATPGQLGPSHRYRYRAIWFVAFVALLPLWNWLERHDHQRLAVDLPAGAGYSVSLASSVLTRHKRAGRIV